VSLRVRVLLSILAVNVGVTALLVVYLLNDLERREQLSRDQAREREQEYVRRFEKIFDGVLSVDPSNRDEVSEAIQVLRVHPLRQLLKDGVILQTDVLKQSQAGAPLDGSALPANATYVNLMGAKHRAPSFDDAHARAQILEAVSKRASERDPKRRGWIAAPIRLVRRGEHDPDAPIWGGGYFLLDLPEESPVAPPTFQPSTILLGMGAGTLVLLALTWLLLERSVLRPLTELAAGASRVAGREYDRPVPGSGSDEIGRVVAGFNSMMSDVGDAERRLTARVDEATRQAEERGRGLVIAQRLAATGTLASGIAHEINNPLGGMLNVALRLKQEEEGGRAKPDGSGARVRYLGLLIDGLTRIQEIVKRVLQFTPRHVEPAVVPLLDLVRKASAFAEHRAKKGKVAISIEGVDAPVLAEPGEMQQVFLNLLLNACDALSESGGRVAVRSRREDGRIVVDVADDGPGMSPEQLAHCFDLFFTTKEPGKGTGLGLSVAHHIVEQHGGVLSAASTPGAGATFTVSLPIAGGAR
jgi:signal transduction histidine kinase